MLTASHTKFTVEDAKTDFIRRINQKHGIQPDTIKKVILAITPYPKWKGRWIGGKDEYSYPLANDTVKL